MKFGFYTSKYIKKRLVTVATSYNKNGQFGTLKPLSAPGLFIIIFTFVWSMIEQENVRCSMNCEESLLFFNFKIKLCIIYVRIK